MDIRRVVIIALLAALIVAGAYISIPIGPVPITLQTLFILLAGLLGGRRIGIPAVAVYLALGAMGLPVFSGGTGGFARFFSPTGGFLLSWLPAVAIAGICSDLGYRPASQEEQTATKKHLLWMILGAVSATIIIYAIGLPILKLNLDFSWSKTIAIGMLPFLPGDLLKLASAVILGNLFSPKVRSFINTNVQEAP
ncbi:MAG: BioY family transporter [Spirochaetae bacterium HGW-Spirochaetae-8]|jgi:biotin transport system substrate-specific component|nr:MAG: BioY family transporter [Spirochaetae bacterium HGW-Spirochaetae-8]